MPPEGLNVAGDGSGFRQQRKLFADLGRILLAEFDVFVAGEDVPGRLRLIASGNKCGQGRDERGLNQNRSCGFPTPIANLLSPHSQSCLDRIPRSGRYPCRRLTAIAWPDHIYVAVLLNFLRVRLFVIADPVFEAQRQPDVVPAVEEALPTKRVNRK